MQESPPLAKRARSGAPADPNDCGRRVRFLAMGLRALINRGHVLAGGGVDVKVVADVVGEVDELVCLIDCHTARVVGQSDDLSEGAEIGT